MYGIFLPPGHFNPHSHAGSDYCGWIVGAKNFISIHTPTQGVTTVHVHALHLFIISIHTPTQGVTAVSGVGCMRDKISIHTPTQGVTANQP